MASSKQRRKELDRYPRYEAMYLKAIKIAMQAINKKGDKYAIGSCFKDEYDALEWWLSDKSVKDYLASKRQLRLF